MEHKNTAREYLQDFTTYDAVKIAFPKVSEKVKRIISSWYDNENDTGNLSLEYYDLKEFVKLIKDDIVDMLDTVDESEKRVVMDELKKYSYL